MQSHSLQDVGIVTDTDMNGSNGSMSDAINDSSEWEDDTGSDASEAPSWVLNETGMPEHDNRRKTVYDAVAGRVRVKEARAPNWAGGPTRHLNTVLPPEEVLYRSRGAPDRYEETDTYFAHEKLAAGVLPDSDLVKAIHHYASQYYEVLALREKQAHDAEKKRAKILQMERQREKKRREMIKRQDAASGKAGKRKARMEYEEEDMADEDEKEQDDPDDSTQKFIFSKQRLLDERSMDETALLAFGILLEEAGRQALGENGDLLFTEAAEEEGGDAQQDGEAKEELEGGNLAKIKEEKGKGKGKAKRRVLDVESGRFYDESSDE